LTKSWLFIALFPCLRGRFQATTLYTIDTLALHRIITHSDVYQKAPMARFHLKQLLGEGA
jgi:hypothetical protein